MKATEMSKQMLKMSGAQSKKRGPKSPNESEKTKVKPETATTFSSSRGTHDGNSA